MIAKIIRQNDLPMTKGIMRTEEKDNARKNVTQILSIHVSRMTEYLLSETMSKDLFLIVLIS